MKWLSVIGLLLCLVGCAGTWKNRIVTDDGAIYVGMSQEMLSEVMGAPHEVGRGRYGCKYENVWPGGFMVNSESVVEWAWHHGTEITVAYLDHGQVLRLGTVKK